MSDALAASSVDRRTLLYQAIAEMCPIAGPVASRLIGEIIPNQRIDRIADVIRSLEEQIRDLKDEHRKRMEEAEFADLFEEGIYQATRAASPERRHFIATIMKNGLTTERVDLLRERRLMMLLGDLNDLEVIILQFYNAMEVRDSATVDRLHENAYGPRAHLGSDMETVERSILHKSHRDRLRQLGLLQARFAFLKRGELPEFDSSSGEFKASSYEISPLGRLLLRAIDVHTIYDDGEA